MGPRKSVRWREKACEPCYILKLPFSFPSINSHLTFLQSKLTLMVCLVVRRESGELESEMVKMESRGNDRKVEFVGHMKSVR